MNLHGKSVSPCFQFLPGLLLLAAALFLLPHHPVQANIATDGTVGPVQTLTGPDFIIPQDLGSLTGANLFHSFRTFNIDTGQSATFTGDNGIANVISRVTGGEASHINGLLRSTIGQADFYFINPSGVVFGSQARVDVPAAFHVSTADELKFADGSSFNARDTGSSTLTQAAPEAFGFLGGQAGNIEINGSRFDFGAERTVSLSGGGMTIQGGLNADGDAVPALLQTEAGHIYLTAVGDRAATVYPDGREASNAGGDLMLDGARVDVSGDGGGRIFIQAGNAVVGGSSVIASDNTGIKASEGGIDMVINGHLQVTSGSRVQSNVFDSGDSGHIHIDASSLLIKQNEGDDYTGIFMEIEPDAAGSGTALMVRVLDDLRIEGAGGIISTTYGDGHAASVTVHAGNISINGEGRLALYKDSSFSARIASEVNQISRGNGGVVTVTAQGLLELVNAVGISGSTWGKGDAGRVYVMAGQMVVDRQGSNYVTGVLSDALSGSEGNAGIVSVTVTDLLQLLNGGSIRSGTFAAGNAGNVNITAKQMTIDGQESNYVTGVLSDALSGSEGNAGIVSVTVTELLQLLNGGSIRSVTFAAGDAGSVSVSAGNLIVDRQGSDYFTGVTSSAEKGSEGNAGQVIITVTELLQILNGGQIGSVTYATGNAGSVTITSGQMTVDRQKSDYSTVVSSAAEKGAEGNAGEVTIKITEHLQLNNGGQIGSGTFAKGNAGSVSITPGQMTVDGQGNTIPAGVFSSSEGGSEGDAGEITITVAELLQILNGGQISSSTFTTGDAGNVTITSGQMIVDGQKSFVPTSVSSSAEKGSEGNAGQVIITVTELLQILNGGQIGSVTWATGNAGSVTITSGQMTLDGQESDYVTGVSSSAERGSEGNAGQVSITVTELLQILNGGQIQSATFATGDSGSVRIMAENMTVDAQESDCFTGVASSAQPGSKGNAGEIIITVIELLQILNGAEVSSSTFAVGNAGNVNITAKQMTIDGQESYYVTGVLSDADLGSEGNAGKITITITEKLQILNDGRIASNTFSTGDAGTVITTAEKLILDSGIIESAAARNASGHVGNILVDSGSISLRSNARISIAANQILSAEKLADLSEKSIQIALNTERLILDQNSRITSESNGNVPAAQIDINAISTTVKNGSRITTSAQNANGGAITISGDVVYLRNGLITTSVEGQTGDGGNITIAGSGSETPAGRLAPDTFLVMNGGFIQANTAAADAKGGDINLALRGILVEKNSSPLDVDNPERQVFQPGSGQNVIQAAAEAGTKGQINIGDAPELDISGDIVQVHSRLAEPATLAIDPCDLALAWETASSLVQGSRGGLPVWPGAGSGVLFDSLRLKKILEEDQ